MEVEIEWDLDTPDGVVYLTIAGTVSEYVPAQTFGPPEDCYPAEGGEVDITHIWEEDGVLWKEELPRSARNLVLDLLHDRAVGIWDGDFEPILTGREDHDEVHNPTVGTG